MMLLLLETTGLETKGATNPSSAILLETTNVNIMEEKSGDHHKSEEIQPHGDQDVSKCHINSSSSTHW